MKICIDDGSTNIKLAWTENGERRNAISPNSFKSEWSAPFGGTQPANYMLDGVRYGFDPVSDRFVQTTDTQYQYSDVNVIAIHHALVKSGITPQEVDVVVTLPLSEYFDTNAQRTWPTSTAKKRTSCARWSTRTVRHSLSVTCGLCLNPFRLALKHWLT